MRPHTFFFLSFSSCLSPMAREASVLTINKQGEENNRETFTHSTLSSLTPTQFVWFSKICDDIFFVLLGIHFVPTLPTFQETKVWKDMEQCSRSQVSVWVCLLHASLSQIYHLFFPLATPFVFKPHGDKKQCKGLVFSRFLCVVSSLAYHFQRNAVVRVAI